MCRNIRPLANFEPPTTDDEIRAAALQYVRKISGTVKPSRTNAEAFDRAVAEVTAASARLLGSLVSEALTPVVLWLGERFPIRQRPLATPRTARKRLSRTVRSRNSSED